jgi:hypothetical protein
LLSGLNFIPLRFPALGAAKLGILRLVSWGGVGYGIVRSTHRAISARG